jgi:hypothetical protein
VSVRRGVLGARVATALHWAAFFGKLAAVQHLVSREADPRGRDATHDGTPLDWCRYRRGGLFRANSGHDAVEEYLADLERATGRY